ncbi:MAG: hypothetical protein M1838_001693 [Thelocarpon superellum]|nr:MAG: hypothetical protein M1838_001693 [Thelocarpon superellum]
MSRRAPNPAADRASQNQQTIKTLLKLEGNKSCADCKRNKHPRWASWNLGVFICIRCSGIHRGMGTHVSRVKSVDLDAWTDEQLQRVLQWGNARANKYWEAKLAPGHVPSEAKIENFIRTKYDSKRWVMDGPMPDPAALDDDGDEDVPLSVVQEKQKLDRSNSARASFTPSGPAHPGNALRTVDLFGDDAAPVIRPSTTEPAITRAVPPKATSVPPKATKPGESLLGLDFFGPSGSQTTSPAAPAAASMSGFQAPAAPSRPDLKQSILSLYASAPRQPDARPAASQQGSFSAMQSAPSQPTASPSAPASSFGGLNDAFSGLSFGTPAAAPPAPKPAKAPAFPNLGSFSQKAAPTVSSTGGSFFDPPQMSAQKSAPPLAAAATEGAGGLLGGFGDLESAPPAPSKATAAPLSSNSGLDDIFDFGVSAAPAAAPAAAPKLASVFNLSSATAASAEGPATKPSTSAATPGAGAGWPKDDAWGSNDAWTAPDSWASKPATGLSTSTTSIPPSIGGGNGLWGGNGEIKPDVRSSAPEVSADEDFGGWSSSAAPAVPTTNALNTANTSAPKAPPGGGVGFTSNDDLFSNVWE